MKSAIFGMLIALAIFARWQLTIVPEIRESAVEENNFFLTTASPNELDKHKVPHPPKTHVDVKNGITHTSEVNRSEIGVAHPANTLKKSVEAVTFPSNAAGVTHPADTLQIDTKSASHPSKWLTERGVTHPPKKMENAYAGVTHPPKKMENTDADVTHPDKRYDVTHPPKKMEKADADVTHPDKRYGVTHPPKKLEKTDADVTHPEKRYGVTHPPKKMEKTDADVTHPDKRYGVTHPPKKMEDAHADVTHPPKKFLHNDNIEVTESPRTTLSTILKLNEHKHYHNHVNHSSML